MSEMQYDKPGNVLADPSPVRQSPFAAGTDQQLVNWINKLNAVLVDLQKAEKAGLNVLALKMRAQNAFASLQRIYQTFYGTFPQS